MQQDLSKYNIAIIVLRARTMRLVDLLALMPEVVRVLPMLRHGTVTEIVAPDLDPPSSGRSRT